jgi:molybdopterin-guanine dinucleotide biosynthesis protein A
MVAVVACDMPFVSPALLQAELDLLAASIWDAAAGLSSGNAQPPLDAVIPRTPHGTEPFHAAYLRSNCLPLVEAAIQSDRWRVDSWYSRARLRFLDPEETRVYDPQELAFRNVNTPEELREAERLALEVEGGGAAQAPEDQT